MITLLLAAATSAIEAGNKHFELELGVGSSFGYENIKPMKNRIGGNIYAEGRYAFSKVPLTLGVYASYNIYGRKYRHTFDITDESGEAIGEVFRETTIDYFSSNFMLTCDYHFQVHPKIKLFAGAGIGFCHVDTSADATIDPDNIASTVSDNGTSGTAAFMPRVGAEFFDHLRLTFGYKFQERANRSAFLSLGYVIRF